MRKIKYVGVCDTICLLHGTDTLSGVKKASRERIVFYHLFLDCAYHIYIFESPEGTDETFTHILLSPEGFHYSIQ